MIAKWAQEDVETLDNLLNNNNNIHVKKSRPRQFSAHAGITQLNAMNTLYKCNIVILYKGNIVCVCVCVCVLQLRDALRVH